MSAKPSVISLKTLQSKEKEGPMNNNYDESSTQYYHEDERENMICLIRNIAQQNKGRKREEKGIR